MLSNVQKKRKKTCKGHCGTMQKKGFLDNESKQESESWNRDGYVSKSVL